MKTVAEVLRGAVTVLDERGWIQGSLELESGECCALGAVRRAQPNWAVGDRAVDLLRDVIHDLDGNLLIAEWNDKDGRTVDEVKAALLAAAERAEAGA